MHRYRLPHLTLQDMALCCGYLRRAGDGVSSLEEAATRVTRFLYDELADAEGRQRACLLVRFYKTHPLHALDSELQAFAREVSQEGAALPDATRCLTLIATIGGEPEWCSRHRSEKHRAIPLPSGKAVERLPMVAQLVGQLGIDVATVVQPDPAIFVDSYQHTFNVFHVPEAEGSPYIPAQESFVLRYGVRSVVGFGGLLPTGDLFAVILFSRVAVSRETAELFKPLALAAKLAVLPFGNGPLFSAP
jgi:two-component system NtrC family sensor kinase